MDSSSMTGLKQEGECFEWVLIIKKNYLIAGPEDPSRITGSRFSRVVRRRPAWPSSITSMETVSSAIL